ncbi:MAG: transposase [Ignavibacteriaceae bacterium]|jgi:REP element-mobilizing transposase RayT
MDKPRNFYKDTYHHLYNRGANKQLIFFEKTNYTYFLEKLRNYKGKYKIEVLSYCLMPNHFHLFVRQLQNELSISDFISSLLNSYTKSINKSYKRNGTLFESKTKNKQILDDTYFKWVIKYILENPVKAGLASNITDWEFSSAKDLFGLRNDNIADLKEIVSYFESETQMKEFLSDSNIKVNYEI